MGPVVDEGGEIDGSCWLAAEATGFDFDDLLIKCRFFWIRQVIRIIGADATKECDGIERGGLGGSREGICAFRLRGF